DVVDLEGAPHALTNLTGSHHEMLDEELAASVEQIGQCHLALRRVEDVLLLDLHPGQRTALGGQSVARPRQLLLLRHERLASSEPFFARDDSGAIHRGFLQYALADPYSAPLRTAWSNGPARDRPNPSCRALPANRRPKEPASRPWPFQFGTL